MGDMLEVTCAECGNTWMAEVGTGIGGQRKPEKCPKCGSRKWNG